MKITMFPIKPITLNILRWNNCCWATGELLRGDAVRQRGVGCGESLCFRQPEQLPAPARGGLQRGPRCGIAGVPERDKPSNACGKLSSTLLDVLASGVSLGDTRYLVAGWRFAGHFIYTPDGEFICMYIYEL